MKLNLLNKKVDLYKKHSLEKIILSLLQVTSLLIIILFTIASGQISAESMVCAIPTENLTKQSETYMKLLEGKTRIDFNMTNKITKFKTPGCHSVQRIAFWTNSIEISCNSNNAEKVNLKINLLTLEFKKTYLKTNDKSRSLSGFCITSQN